MNTRDPATKGLKWGCCSAAGFGLLMLGAWAVTSVFWYHHDMAPQTRCQSNLKQISVAIEMYADAWDGHRPPLYTSSQHAPRGKAWPDLLMPYLEKIEGGKFGNRDMAKLFRCPEAPDDRVSYSTNPRIAGTEQPKLKRPEITIAVFDSVNDSPENNNLNGDSIWRPSHGGVPAVGCLPLWPERQPLLGPKLPKWASPRHRSMTDVLWADGHVGAMNITYKPDLSPSSPRFDPAKPVAD